MIENYNEVAERYGCNQMMEINPEEDMRRWCVQQTITILANADYYYTKTEVDKLIEGITASGVTKEEVEEMIATAIATKANQAQVDAIAAQVAQNTERLLNTYTKAETNSLLESYLSKIEAIQMRDNYSRVDNTTLVLNNELEINL